MTAATAALTDTFREVMAGVCTPVSVVTVMVDGRPHGTTVSGSWPGLWPKINQLAREKI
ncbi:hypothetical protein [Pseudonocardia oceani]|uniref:hypothetical protein n=1 Tax=Pseudonocardia oceani TaxID=2792013 RepID=UPI001C4A0F05|nr:hypothetical protein [Pseudonocardia oceani]